MIGRMVKKPLAICLLFVTAACAAESGSELNSGPKASFGSPTDGGVVVLQRFVVEATRIGGPPWKYASIPGFEILSHCKDSDTKRYIRALILGNAVHKALLPDECLSSLSAPSTIILYDNPSEPSSAKSVIPRPVEISSSYDKTVWGPLGGGGYSFSDPGEAFDLDTTADCANLWGTEKAIFVIFSDSFWFRLAHHVPSFPSWFLQGLSGRNGLYKNYGVSGSKIAWLGKMRGEVPTAQWISDAETELIRKKSAAAVPFLPMDELFARKNPQRSDTSSLWFAEAGLFLRWGLYEKAQLEPSHQAAFWTFVNRATAEPVTEQMFRECFGFGFAEMEIRLERYLPKAVSEGIQVPLNADSGQAVPELRNATEAEIARIVGDWERIEGRSLKADNPELSREYLEEADKTLLKPYSKGNRDPQLLGVLGLYERAVGADNKAREFLEAAAKGQVARPSVYLTLAQLRYSESATHPAGPNGKLSSDQVAAVLGPLLVARNQTPSMAETYRLMADTWSHSAVKPTLEDFAVLDRGVRLFWRNFALANAVEKLRIQWGYAADPTKLDGP